MTFPSYNPTSRSFNAGDYVYKKFTSQSGKEIRILYGDKRTGMGLELGYENIPDTQADNFITHYDEVKGGFNSFVLPSVVRAGWTGSTTAIDAATGNQWRYDSPPDIRSVRLGISSVTVKLVAVL